MQTFAGSRSMFVLVALVACDVEAPEEALRSVSPETAPSDFHAAVGAPIDAATAKRWIENLRRAEQREGASYTLPAATLRRLLALPGSVGVSLYYGLDDAGELELFPVGTDREGRAIAGLSEGARRPIRRYTGPVSAHFFGRDTFTRLLDEQRSEAVRVTPARDDEAGPQLLLSDAAEEDPHTYEDASFPVPEDSPILP